jgi:hypothetical protein
MVTTRYHCLPLKTQLAKMNNHARTDPDYKKLALPCPGAFLEEMGPSVRYGITTL